MATNEDDPLAEPADGMLRPARLALFVGAECLLLTAVVRVAVFGSVRDTVVAVLVTGVTAVVQIWQFRVVARNTRPPRPVWTFLGLALLQMIGTLLIGSLWALSLTSVAIAALLGLRTVWGLLGLVGCAAAATAATIWQHWGLTPAVDRYPLWFPAFVVLYNSVTLVALVRSLAVAYELSLSRTEAAAARAVREQAELVRSIDDMLAEPLDELIAVARRAKDALAVQRLDAVVGAADRTLATLRQTVSGLHSHDDGAAKLPAHRVSEPADYRTGVGHIRWAAIAVFVVVVPFPLLMTLGEGRPLVAVGAWLVAAGSTASTAFRVATGRPVTLRAFRVLVPLAVAVAAIGLLGGLAETFLWFPAVGALLCLPTRWGIGIASATVLGLAVVDLLSYYPSPLLVLVWRGAYAVTGAIPMAALVAAVIAVRQVDEIAAHRDVLAERAVNAERLRVSSALHDVLGQTLTAISLKGDLARRLLPIDPGRAATEVDEIIEIGQRQRGDLQSAIRSDRPGTLDDEIAGARDLLEAAGVAVETHLALVETADPAQQTICAWVIREATTNILRHARACRVSITVQLEERALRLEVRNDGARGAGPKRGDSSGLAGLARRVTAADGTFEAGPTPQDGFHVTVSLPARMPQRVTP